MKGCSKNGLIKQLKGKHGCDTNDYILMYCFPKVTLFEVQSLTAIKKRTTEKTEKSKNSNSKALKQHTLPSYLMYSNGTMCVCR